MPRMAVTSLGVRAAGRQVAQARLFTASSRLASTNQQDSSDTTIPPHSGGSSKSAVDPKAAKSSTPSSAPRNAVMDAERQLSDMAKARDRPEMKVLQQNTPLVDAVIFPPLREIGMGSVPSVFQYHRKRLWRGVANIRSLGEILQRDIWSTREPAGPGMLSRVWDKVASAVYPQRAASGLIGTLKQVWEDYNLAIAKGDIFEASSYCQDAALDFAKARCRQSEGMNIKWNVEWVRPPRIVHARAFPAMALDPDTTSCAQVVLKMETRQTLTVTNPKTKQPMIKQSHPTEYWLFQRYLYQPNSTWRVKQKIKAYEGGAPLPTTVV